MNEALFADLVNKTKSAVLAAISNYLPISLMSFTDDIVQETYYKAYAFMKKKKGFEIQSLENFLYTIAKNETLLFIKKETKYQSLISVLQYQDISADRPKLDFFAFIRKLPFVFQNVCILFYQGVAISEIVNTLNLDIGTVKSRLHRGKKILKNELKKECLK
jgi:RNA polymerase sigma-70 factor (ECF subfamily)